MTTTAEKEMRDRAATLLALAAAGSLSEDMLMRAMRISYVHGELDAIVETRARADAIKKAAA